MIATLSIIDFVIIAVILLSAMTGLVRGFIKEIVSLAIWVIAGWLAFSYAKPVATWVSTYIQDKSIQVIVAYVVIIIGTIIVGAILNAMLSFMMHHSGLTGTDRALGFGFGAIRGIFLVALIMVVIRLSAFPEDDYRHKSQLYRYFTPTVNWLYQYTPNILKRVEDLEQQTQPIRNNHTYITVKDFEAL